MQMKRFMVAALVTGSLLGSVVGVGAATGDNPNCVGQAVSSTNQVGKDFGFNGLGGHIVSEIARQDGGLGQVASNNCGG